MKLLVTRSCLPAVPAKMRARYAQGFACASSGSASKLDPDTNSSNAALVSTPQSRIEVRVVPSDEEAMIAPHTLDMSRDDHQDSNE